MATPAPRTLGFAVRGPIGRADLPGLAERICALFSDNQGVVFTCDVTGVPPDAVTIDALARLQLVARRNGCQVRLCHGSTELLQLVSAMGLADVLPSD